MVDDVGQASLQDSEGFEAAVAVCSSASDESAGAGVVVRLRERNPVDGGVELPRLLSRCRARLDDQTGSGAVPLWRA